MLGGRTFVLANPLDLEGFLTSVGLGYWNKPEASAETFVDGWLRTGDLGRIDSDGLIYIVDRAAGKETDVPATIAHVRERIADFEVPHT